MKAVNSKQSNEEYHHNLNNHRYRNRLHFEQSQLTQKKICISALTQKVRTISQLDSLSPKKFISKAGRASDFEKSYSNVDRQTYSHRIREFESSDPKQKSTQQLKSEMKNMRTLLQQLNFVTTSKLNKYGMANFEPKQLISQNETQKEISILSAKIKTNVQTIESLEVQIKQLQSKDREMEETDYMLSLEEETNQTIIKIKQKRKEKAQQDGVINKLDQKLISMKDNVHEDEFWEVKMLKTNIFYHLKKFHENAASLEQLHNSLEDLIEKDKILTEKYNKYIKVAEQRNMCVKANHAYVQNKNVSDKLECEVELEKKKMQILKRSNNAEIKKLQRENESLRKEIIVLEAMKQKAFENSKTISKTIEEEIYKNGIGKRLLNSISYKFAQHLFKDSSLRYNQMQTIDLQSDLKPEIQKNIKYKLLKPKPKLKLIQKGPLNQSVQVTARYSSLNTDETDHKEHKDFSHLQLLRLLNDKNISTINTEENKGKQFRIKPNLTIKKRTDNQSKLTNTTQTKPDKASSFQIAYKPKKFSKILSERQQKDSK